VAIEITTFYRLTKAFHPSLALVATPVSLFLGRFFASPHFGSISESVVVVGDPEHDRLGRPVFHGISKRTHLLTSLTPMIAVIGQHRRWVVIGHRNARAEYRIFINVGARAAIPPIPGLDRVPYLTNSASGLPLLPRTSRQHNGRHARYRKH
jgi:hypothetical protein